MRNLLSVSVGVLLYTLLLAACGQKGPLFLPGDPSEIKTDVPRQEPATDEEKDEDEETGQ